MRSAIRTKNNYALMEAMYNIHTEQTMRDLGTSYEPLAAILDPAKALETASEGALNKLQAIAALFFAKELMPLEVAKGETYFDPENRTYAQLHIPCFMEYDTTTQKTIFIFHNQKIGEGYFKQVYKGLLTDNSYTTYQPIAYALAKGITADDLALDIKNHEKTKNFPGILQTLAITCHKRGGNIVRRAIVTKLYKTGNLGNFLKKNSLPIERIIQIAKNVLTGLTHLHNHGYTHRDLKPGNILLEHTATNTTAVIADLGQMCTIKEAKGRIPNATDEYNPPEAFKKRKKVRYRAADVFSLGLIFHQMLARKKTGWMTRKILTRKVMNDGPEKEKKTHLKKFVEKLRAYRKKIEHSIAQAKKQHHPAAALVLTRKFKELILQMVQKKRKRASASTLLAKINEIS